MTTSEAEAVGMWKRLIWREYREGRLALLLALLIPALMVRPAAFYQDRSARNAFGLARTLGANLVILFWAVSRGDSRRVSADSELARVPISPFSALTASFTPQSVPSALLGAA
ncbi:MAG: hypothetical protein ACP5R5_09175 [Armatimonadota bacterium]